MENKLNSYLIKIAENSYDEEKKKLNIPVIAGAAILGSIGLRNMSLRLYNKFIKKKYGKGIGNFVISGKKINSKKFTRKHGIDTVDNFYDYMNRYSLNDLPDNNLTWHLKQMHKNKFIMGNPGYVPKVFKKGGFIIADKKSTRLALGHEIGHFRDLKKKPYILIHLESMVAKTPSEIRAWNKSPIKHLTDLEKKQKQVALNTYKISDIANYVGLGSGGYAAYKLTDQKNSK